MGVGSVIEQHPQLTLFLGVAIFVIGYFLSLHLHPYTKCNKCDGTSVHRGAVFSGSRKCHKCSGTGRKQRLGAALLKIGDKRVSTKRWHRRKP